MRVLGLLVLLLAAPSFAESERAKTVLLFVPEDVAVPATADFTRSFRQTVRLQRGRVMQKLAVDSVAELVRLMERLDPLS